MENTVLTKTESIETGPALTAAAAPVNRSAQPTPAVELSLPGRVLSEILRPSVRQGLLVLFDQGGYSISTFLTGILVARASTKAEYATFVLGLTLVFLSGLLQQTLVTIPYTVLSQSLSPPERSAYLGSSFLQHVIFSFLIVIAFLASWVIAQPFGQRTGVTGLLAPLAAVAVGLHLRTFTRSMLLAELRTRASFTMSLAANAVTAGSILTLYFTGRLTILTACFAMTAGSAIPALVILLINRKSLKIRTCQITPDFKQNWRYGKWMLAASAAGMAGLPLLPWLTLLWCGRETVAVVAVITTTACMARPALKAAVGYLTPKLANYVQSKGTAPAIRKTIVLVNAAVIMAGLYVLFMFVFGDKIIGILYTSKYHGHAFALVIMAAAIGIKAVNVPVRALITAVKRPEIICRASICASGFALLAGIPAISRFDVIGVAMVVVIYHLVLLSVNYLGILRWSKRTMTAAPETAPFVTV